MDRKTNILIVDDDDVDVMNVRRAFTKAKVDDPLFHAEDGVQALEMLRGELVPKERRLILLDLNMPRMSGLEFLRELRADRKLCSTPVVILTTSDAQRDRVAAYELQAAGYLVKPIQFAQFIEAMETLHRYWSLSEMP